MSKPKKTIYNASDFPVSFQLIIPPNQGFDLDDLIDLCNEQGGYLYFTDNPVLVGRDRIMTKTDLERTLKCL